MEYSEDYLNSLLQELEKHYGEEFKNKILELLNAKPNYIELREISGKTFGAIRCCFESKITTKKDFLRYIISQEFDGKKEQAILHLGKISRDPLLKFLGKHVEILGVKAEYNYGVPLVKIDLRASRIKIIGKCRYTVPSNLKVNTNYYCISGFIRDISWKYMQNSDKDWIKIKIIDLNQEAVLFCDTTCVDVLKEALEDIFGIELMKFTTKSEYMEYYTAILSEIMYRPVQITTEKSMRCFQKEDLVLSLKQNQENIGNAFKIQIEELDSKKIVESCCESFGIFNYGAIGVIKNIVLQSEGIYQVSIDFGGEIYDLMFHPEGIDAIEEGNTILIFYRDPSDLYASSKGDLVILTEKGYYSLIREFRGDKSLITHTIRLPRAIILD